MRNFLAVLCAVVQFGWLLCAPAAAMDDVSGPSQTDMGRERAALLAVIAQSRQPKPDVAAMSAALKTILADPAFLMLSDDERHVGYVLYGALLLDARDWDGAMTALRAATQMAQAGAFDWNLRLQAGFRLSDYADATISATRLAQHWPDKLSGYRDGAIFLLGRESQKIAGFGDSAREFLEALHAIKWKPIDGFGHADGLWLALMRIRLERGDVDGAKALAADLHDPVTFLEMRADRRFDAIVQADPARYDVMKGFEAELAERRTEAAAAPDKLEGINAVANLLRRLGRAGEALDAIDAALKRAETRPQPFADHDDQINWTQDQRSQLLFLLGRDDEAVAALAKGAALKEDGNAVNVSQAINLADVYDSHDRPKDALAAVATLDFSNASNYGRMALEDARACAYFELGDAKNLAEVLQYMKAHAGDGSQPYLNTMLCTGDLDGAAAEVLAELGDPVRRLDALYFLQDYLPQSHATKREEAIHAAWIAMRSRPDVAAAIDKVGRINSYAILSPSY